MLRIDKCSLGGPYIQAHVFTTMVIVMVHYTRYERSYFSLLKDNYLIGSTRPEIKEIMNIISIFFTFTF